tara:strand:- start:123 stop:779 length:657 start_codon:yes stop_codon:yes gene_type:complete
MSQSNPNFPTTFDVKTIDIQSVNNIKQYREKLLTHIGNLGEMIFGIKEHLDTQTYIDLYSEMSRIHNTEIIATIKYKQKLDRKNTAVLLTDAEKVKKNYHRCEKCNTYLSTIFSLKAHQRRDKCRTLNNIVSVTKVVNKPKGNKKLFASKLQKYHDSIILAIEFVRFHKHFVKFPDNFHIEVKKSIEEYGIEKDGVYKKKGKEWKKQEKKKITLVKKE